MVKKLFASTVCISQGTENGLNLAYLGEFSVLKSGEFIESPHMLFYKSNYITVCKLSSKDGGCTLFNGLLELLHTLFPVLKIVKTHQLKKRLAAIMIRANTAGVSIFPLQIILTNIII